MIETWLASLPVQECAHVLVPEPSDLAMRYYRSGNILWILQLFWSLAVPFFILWRGWSGKMERLAQGWTKKWYPQLVLYLVLFFSLVTLFNFPLDLYSDFLRPHEYGLSNQGFGRWIGQWGKSFLLSLVFAAAFVWIFYLLLKKSPKRWWFYSSLVSIGISFFLVFIQPIWIAPLFHTFGPMKNQVLEEKILALAHRCGIEDARVFEVDMSQDTKSLNAYVTGFGASKRIVLWDTTIDKLSTDEILFVMGHEMGHYVLHHVWWYLLFFSLVTFLLFYLTYRSSHFLMKRYGKSWGFTHLYQFASLPLLLLTLTFFQFLFSPLFMAFSRHFEHQADIFGLEITQNNEAAGEAFIALQQQNLANPRPGKFFIFFRASHPPIGSRVDFTNSYCPWERNCPLKYGKYFQDSE